MENAQPQHTPEPWIAKGQAIVGRDTYDRAILETYASDAVDRDEAEANARRIVACVNACNGADDTMLTVLRAMGGLGAFWKDAEEANAQMQLLTNANAELMAALNALLEVYGPISTNMRIGSDRRELWRAASMAVKKAEAAQ